MKEHQRGGPCDARECLNRDVMSELSGLVHNVAENTCRQQRCQHQGVVVHRKSKQNGDESGGGDEPNRQGCAGRFTRSRYIAGRQQYSQVNEAADDGPAAP